MKALPALLTVLLFLVPVSVSPAKADFCGSHPNHWKCQPPPPPPPPPPSTSTCSAQSFCGDFETGDFSQYWLKQWNGTSSGCGGPCTISNVGDTSATIITSPVAQGTYAAKFQVHPAPTAPNDRAEILQSPTQADGLEGHENYYGWWVYFPAGQTFWNGGGQWNAFTQFFDSVYNGGIVGLGINSVDYAGIPHVVLNSAGQTDLGALQFDHWYHFILHAKWSTNSAVGFIDFWVDGVNRVPLVHRQTLRDPNGLSNISYGYYSHNSSENTVIHDGFCRAPTFDAAAAC